MPGTLADRIALVVVLLDPFPVITAIAAIIDRIVESALVVTDRRGRDAKQPGYLFDSLSLLEHLPYQLPSVPP
jgi:hypothetical protein